MYIWGNYRGILLNYVFLLILFTITLLMTEDEKDKRIEDLEKDKRIKELGEEIVIIKK